MSSHSRRTATVLLLLLASLSLSEALWHASSLRFHQRRVPTPICAAKKKVAKKKPSGGFGAKKAGGFGAAPAAKKQKELSPERQQWVEFMDWVTTSGGSVDSVRLADCGGGLRGLQATRDLSMGDEIIRIPRAIMLDVARAEASPISGVWKDCADELPGYVKIALAVIYERRLGADSDLVPYLGMLPTAADFESDGGPAAKWSDEELAVTECGKLIDASKARREQSYGSGHPALQPAALAASWGANSLPGESPSPDELSWAVTAVTSRAYGVGSPAAGAPPESGLIPVVDMANHDGRYPQHTAKGLEEDGKSFVVLATEPIKRGQQVCLTYGNLANFLLLPQFGFVLPDLGSPPDIALVDCASVMQHVKQSGGAVLDELADEGLLMRDGDGSVSNWQSAGSRLQAALYTLAKVGSLPSGAAAADGAADTSPAHFALGAYTGLLQGTLDAFSTSIAEDRKALGLTAGGKASAAADGDGMPPRAILATQFRLSQKTLLNQAIAAAVKLGAEGVIDGAAALKFETLGARAYAKAAADPSAIRTPSGLVLQHEVEGTGASPTSADTVEVHYEGKNADGIVFDSSYARGDPIAFPVTGVIAGWTEGLQLMKVGGKALLTIPPQLAYGDKGSPPKIPARATLTFTVELLAIKEPGLM